MKPTAFDLDAIRNARVYTVSDQSTGKIANAWNAPQTSYSTLRTFMAAASYVTGSHSFRVGMGLTNGDWRRTRAFAGDASAITYNAGVPVQVTLQLPWDHLADVEII